MQALITLRVNLATSPATKALKAGRVRSDLVRLDCCGPDEAHRGFRAMLQGGSYDAGELAVATCLQARIRGLPFVLLPICTAGRFQHGAIVQNRAREFLHPKALEGRRVGLRAWSQTSGMWARGLLRHEWGVDLDKVRWQTLQDGHVPGFADPACCERLAGDADMAGMLLRGEVAALIQGVPFPECRAIQPVIPEVAIAARRWYEREGIVPINHMFVVSDDLSRKRPDVVRELFRMLVDGRAEAHGAPGPVIPVGLEANRKALQLAIDWSLEQRIIPRRLQVDELFDDLTGSLVP